VPTERDLPLTAKVLKFAGQRSRVMGAVSLEKRLALAEVASVYMRIVFDQGGIVVDPGQVLARLVCG